MAGFKFEIYSLPQIVARDGNFWFKLKYDAKGNSQPGSWQEPVDDDLIKSVLEDPSLKDKRIEALVERSGRDRWACSQALQMKKWPSRENAYLSISTEDFQRQEDEPVRCGSRYWLYRTRVVKVTGDGPVDDLPLLVKHKVLSHENALTKIQREVEAFQNFETLRRTSREPIPEQVRMFVWQRDQGQCVKCGCRERLEYDHIIALAKGGSNTERNIQLLCETCNRQKGASV